MNRRGNYEVGLFLLAALFMWTPAHLSADDQSHTPPRRTMEVGVVDARKYEHAKSERYHKNGTQPLFDRIKELELDPQWLTVDIFLDRHKLERDTYKRIVIPYYANAFAPEMHAGMSDYVSGGGLLISNNGMLNIDVNADYKISVADGDKSFSRASPFATLGVFAHSGVEVSTIKCLAKCPLTAGLPIGQTIPFEKSFVMPWGINSSATVVISAEGTYKGTPKSNLVYVSFKNQGRGACIFIVPFMLLRTGELPVIMQNALSPDTLEWLTAGDD